MSKILTSKKSEIIDGFTIKYHANGKTVWSKGKILDGKPEGYWEWYRIDGTLKRSGNFQNGETVGEWITYDKNGEKYKFSTKNSITMDKFTVDQYISTFDEEIQTRLTELRKLFFEVIPTIEESIRYKIPAYKVGNHYLYFAAYKNHIGFYPVYGLTELEDDLVIFRAKGTKDSLHFLYSNPLPINLIKKIIYLKSMN